MGIKNFRMTEEGKNYQCFIEVQLQMLKQVVNIKEMLVSVKRWCVESILP
jgi:hypothetical protein